MKSKRISRSLLLLILLISIKSIHAQTPDLASKSDDKSFKFMPIPYINYDRTQGFSFGAIPMAIYSLNKNDTISPSSISGGFGMYTTNKSWFVLQFNKWYFKEDKYRAILAMGSGEFNSQFFLDLPVFSDFINYSTALSFFKIEMQRKIIEHLYVGLNYSYAKLLTQPDINDDIDDKLQQKSYLNGLGAIVSFDGRNDVYYPHKGLLTNLKYSTYPGFMGNEFVSNKIELDFNQFLEMKNKRDIIGVRLYTGIGIGDLNFNQQFVVGNNDIRGYTENKYRGKQLVALQGEYRWNPMKKLGFVGFAGVASVFSGVNDDDNGKILPAIGTGFRYQVFPKNHMNVGMDFAAGIGDWGIYFKIGEAF